MNIFTLLSPFLVVLPLLGADYDPLSLPAPGPVASHDVDVADDKRSRHIPLRLYLPATSAASPVVFFSHGLGGSREGNAFMGQHWAARGYVCVFLQHPGSDEAVWKDVPMHQRLVAMRAAASLENFNLRVGDVTAILDQLAMWQSDKGHDLHGRLDLTRIGMSGHSFGAVTTQAVSGQRYGMRSLTDARIRAAIAFSPSSPGKRGDPATAFGAVTIPWLLMTGTHDTAVIAAEQTPATRREVYRALPANGFAYELVLDQAEHSAFTDRSLPVDTLPRNPNHHRALLAISTAFWDAWLRQDAAARAWLDGDGPRRVVQAADVWQRK